MPNAASLLPLALLLVLPSSPGPQDEGPRQDHGDPPAAVPLAFDYPCDGYTKGLRGKGNFGAYVDPRRTKSVFADSYHLAEDVWVEGGTEVRSVADGRVVYSDFSPTWTDEAKHVHWNLGNVIVIEHELGEARKEGEPEQLCSVYVHLGADRRVKTGECVARGQVIGTVGADRSEENGRYPAHLHFGLHQGPYLQISPAWKRDLEREAREFGLPCGNDQHLVKGEIELTKLPGASVRIDFVGQEETTFFSLLMGSTSPDYHPADIAAWCEGYGNEETVKEWIRPSTWIRKHREAKPSKSSSAPGKPDRSASGALPRASDHRSALDD